MRIKDMLKRRIVPSELVKLTQEIDKQVDERMIGSVGGDPTDYTIYVGKKEYSDLQRFYFIALGGGRGKVNFYDGIPVVRVKKKSYLKVEG
jgi:hypothetical protein